MRGRTNNGIAAIVTGGASGLGCWCEGACEKRCKSYDIRYERRALGKARAFEIGAQFGKVNVADKVGVSSAYDAAEADHGIALVLVNCAGVAKHSAQAVHEDRFLAILYSNHSTKRGVRPKRAIISTVQSLIFNVNINLKREFSSGPEAVDH